MVRERFVLALVGAAAVSAVPSGAQVIPLEQRVFNEQVLRPSGQPVIPLYDGWYENPDGTKSICFGFFNLNTEEPVDIPLGPDNFIEPAEYDGLQPTHFDPAGRYRRHFCVFTANVPGDFGDGRVVWTLTRNGETASTPGKVIPPYILDEPESGGRGIVPPVLKLTEDGPAFRGRSGYTAPHRTVSVGQPLTLTVWVDHPDPTVWVGWFEHQGPGHVVFADPELSVDTSVGIGTTTARFSEPGEYLLRVQSIHSIASFEYHCCWTNGYVPVTVTR